MSIDGGFKQIYVKHFGQLDYYSLQTILGTLLPLYYNGSLIIDGDNEVDSTVGAEIAIADAIDPKSDTTVYSENGPDICPNEFCDKLTTQKFQSGVETYQEFNITIIFRWTTMANQITIISATFEEHTNKDINQFNTTILCMIKNKNNLKN